MTWVGFYNGRRFWSKRKVLFGRCVFHLADANVWHYSWLLAYLMHFSLIYGWSIFYIPKHGPSNPDVLPALSLAAIFPIHGITLNRPSRNDVVLPTWFSNSLVECRSDYCVVVECCWCPARNNPVHHPPWKCKTLMYFIFTIEPYA
jgi:hypothetical protein